MTERFDVLVIGGGPGGYVAAIRAAQLGLRTALVERKHLGGICLNWGCIPTKAMLRGAEMAHSLTQMERFGFSVDNPRFDLGRLVRHSRSVSAQLAAGVESLMKKNGIQVFNGTGRLTDKGRVRVTDAAGNARELAAVHVILATGARPRSLPGLEPDGRHVWSYFEALVPERLPESLLVIGSGAIGMEFASLYGDLGSRITLVELAPRLMPAEDAEVSDFMRKEFEKRGMTIHCATQVVGLQRDAEGVDCRLRPAEGREIDLRVEKVLVAAGVRANIEDLGLEALGVETERGFIKTDAWGRTNVAGLYAIGDVAGAPCLAHKASHEAVVCVEHLAGVEGAHPLQRARIPACTYTRPQVASLGLTEEAARGLGRAVQVGRFPFRANGKALAQGDAGGFVKTLFDADTGELLGAHMVGPEVTEQIQGFAIAQGLEATADSLLATVFPHPSLSEAMHEAVLAAAGRALHQ